MNLPEFENNLVPFKERLGRITFIKSLISSVNQVAIIILIASLVILTLDLTLKFYHYQIPFLFRIIVFVLILLYGAIFVTLISRHKLSGGSVAARIDQVSNKHDMIQTAYDFIKCGKDSGFAQIAIIQGLEKLNETAVLKIAGNYQRLKIHVILAAFLSLSLSLTVDHLSLVSNPNFVYKTNESAKSSSLSLLPSNGAVKQKENALSATHHDDSLLPLERSNLTPMLSTNHSLSSSNGSYLLSEASSQSKKNNVVKDENIIKQSNFTHNAKLSGSGNGLTPPVETSVKVDFLSIDVSLTEDQFNSKVKDNNKSANLSKSAKLPFTDDRRPAPGRELGRSGKKGKPGDGRGGLGSFKKSRSTASIFPGEKIKVHIKSSPGKGKSKSFQVNSPLQQSENNDERHITPEKTDEGTVDPYIVKEHLKIITMKYFQELNSYANKVSTER